MHAFAAIRVTGMGLQQGKESGASDLAQLEALGGEALNSVHVSRKAVAFESGVETSKSLVNPELGVLDIR